MKKSLLSILICIPFLSLAQNDSCDGTRFLNDIFEIDSTMNVIFGNSTTVEGVNADLAMDIYYPVNDVAQLRPLLIFAHGGSFIFGTRENMSWLCRDFARKGYVTATIDYRLFDGPLFPIPDSLIMSDVVIKATSDARAAVRHFRQDVAENGNSYTIDPNMILVGGISAGAILMSHLAYLEESDVVENFLLEIIEENGGWEGNSNDDNLGFSSAVNGVLSYSGALRSKDYINSGDVPILSVHDDMDGVVPYGDDFATILSFPIIRLNGSGVLAQRADEVGVVNDLITIENSTGHVSYFGDEATASLVLETSYEFMHEIVCQGALSTSETTSVKSLSVFPNPAADRLIVEVPLGMENADLRIFNTVGQVVHQTKVSNYGNLELDISSLANGIYTAVLQSATKPKLQAVSKISVQ